MQYGNYGNEAASQSGALAPSTVAFLKRVYGLFTASIVCSAIGATIALTAGADVSRVSAGTVAIPPLVYFFAKNWWAGALLMLGTVFGASAVRHKPGINVVALFGMATVVGAVIAPAIFLAQLAAQDGGTLSPAPVRDAFLLATAGFTGLTGYALTTQRDFSYLGGALTMGLFVVIGAGLLNFFVGSSALGLAIASVSVLLFGAFILYDTSRILRSGERDAVGAAISLYLNFLNLFLALLRLLGGRRGD